MVDDNIKTKVRRVGKHLCPRINLTDGGAGNDLIFRGQAHR